MLKGIKNTGLLFLGLAGLIFFLHLVIPHHHHYNTVPESNQQAGNHHSNGKPLHCHAFNDLAIDKIIFTINNISVPAAIPAVIIENTNLVPNTGRQNGRVISYKQNDKIPSLLFLKSFPTRGSPLTA